MTLPSSQYRDPAKVYEAKEAKTCKGCKHEKSVVMLGKQHTYCGKGKRHGWKCAKYEEPGDDTCQPEPSI